MDLLLVQSSLLLAWARDNKVDIPNINTEYHIVVLDSGDYEIDLLQQHDDYRPFHWFS